LLVYLQENFLPSMGTTTLTFGWLESRQTTVGVQPFSMPAGGETPAALAGETIIVITPVASRATATNMAENW